MAMAAPAGASLRKKLLFPLTPPLASSKFLNLNLCHSLPSSASVSTCNFSATTAASTPTRIRKNKNKKKEEQKEKQGNASSTSRRAAEALVKRRTRSEIEFDEETVLRFGDSGTHIPVMLGEVLEVFSSVPLRSFVDCTLGAAGHSSAVIQAHREMQSYIGLDVDPVAHEKARARINVILQGCSCDLPSNLKVHTLLKNFKDIKPALCEVDEKLLVPGVDGILMDLGMSSMQVNSAERGFSVLSNGPLDMRMNPQFCLHILLVKGRLAPFDQFDMKLASVVNDMPGGRQGWIKTATRVFQALRIAVNDELKTLEDSLYNCFDCLAPGGRLAVISFHSLEDRIVKQTFLNIINSNVGDGHGDEKEESCFEDSSKISFDKDRKEAWIKQTIYGPNARILTKRPITPTEEEEKLNCRSRSAKLRVIQKA
ncbi:hypothetical protein RJ639_040478 [Escallonia herrerae]|uniref:Ribosomal RNA small subunit methyltransferase H n=1 Tax=Escallonia herrerae TaxID=1293975 RepID=A0AA89BB36_9ASTE|nr:hypothetical protein RJ639_040478 [Escallonia herrerae]